MEGFVSELCHEILDLALFNRLNFKLKFFWALSCAFLLPWQGLSQKAVKIKPIRCQLRVILTNQGTEYSAGVARQYIDSQYKLGLGFDESDNV